MLEARANVLEALADDENAAPDALLASEILSRAKGAASVPAALLAKWRLEGGLDDLLEMLSRGPPRKAPSLLQTYKVPPPIKASPIVGELLKSVGSVTHLNSACATYELSAREQECPA
jgi:hypothetical protein